MGYLTYLDLVQLKGMRRRRARGKDWRERLTALVETCYAHAVPDDTAVAPVLFGDIRRAMLALEAAEEAAK